MKIIHCLPLLIYFLSFITPAGVANSGEILMGYAIFLQGMLVAILFLGSLGSLNLYLGGLFVCWLSNFIFLYAYRLYIKTKFKSAILFALISGGAMSIFLTIKQALISGHGEQIEPIELMAGYFIWLAAPLMLGILCLLRLTRKSS